MRHSIKRSCVQARGQRAAYNFGSAICPRCHGQQFEPEQNRPAEVGAQCVIGVLERGVAHQSSRKGGSRHECAEQQHDDADELDDTCSRGDEVLLVHRESTRRLRTFEAPPTRTIRARSGGRWMQAYPAMTGRRIAILDPTGNRVPRDTRRGNRQYHRR